MWAVWILVGVAIGALGAAPVLRILLRRAEQRARAAQRRARDAQRLAELGSMTAGLAHEIKNPLSTIGLNAQLLPISDRDDSHQAAPIPFIPLDRLRVVS